MHFVTFNNRTFSGTLFETLPLCRRLPDSYFAFTYFLVCRLPACRLRLVYPMRLYEDHHQKEEFQTTFQHHLEAQFLVLIATWQHLEPLASLPLTAAAAAVAVHF